MKVSDRPLAPAGSPLMTVDEAAVYLRFLDAEGRPDRDKFYQWKRRANPRCYRLGQDARLMRFRREDLDAVLVPDGGAAAPAKPHFADYRRRYAALTRGR